MEAKRTKRLLVAMFALSLAVGGGFLLAKTPKSSLPEVVLAEGEEPGEAIPGEEETPSEETPSEETPSEETPSEQSSESTGEATATSVETQNIGQTAWEVLVNTFKDALKDLINHIKHWLSLLKK